MDIQNCVECLLVYMSLIFRTLSLLNVYYMVYMILPPIDINISQLLLDNCMTVISISGPKLMYTKTYIYVYATQNTALVE